MNKINLAEKFKLFDATWTPKIVGRSNAQLIKLAKGKGELVWHVHENEDELFLVISGKLIIQMREQNIELNPGEMFIVPKGVEHCPRAEELTEIMLIEPESTKHTGKKKYSVTVETENQEWI